MSYSFETSLPPYREAPELKRRQADELYAFIRRGANNLLQLAELSGLPQSTVSGRCNDLIEENKICYQGYTVYNDRKRKKIIVKQPMSKGQQAELLFLDYKPHF